MRTLNPTLWRTCRMLSGAMRIRLLRLLANRPGMTVTEMAEALGIGVSDSSQELRRIQSRGFLKADRIGSYVYYCLQADPQVPSAAPLISAVTSTLDMVPEENDGSITKIAFGLAHPRRISILRELLHGPSASTSLANTLGWREHTLNHHLRLLKEAGFAMRQRGRITAIRPTLPLASTLINLVENP